MQRKVFDIKSFRTDHQVVKFTNGVDFSSARTLPIDRVFGLSISKILSVYDKGGKPEAAIVYSVWLLFMFNRKKTKWAVKDRIAPYEILSMLQDPPLDEYGSKEPYMKDVFWHLQRVIDKYNRKAFDYMFVVDVACMLHLILGHSTTAPKTIIRKFYHDHYRLFLMKFIPKGNNTKRTSVKAKRQAICVSCVLCDADITDENEVREKCNKLCDFLNIKKR